MNENVPQLFFETVQDKLSFLVNEYRFTGPYSDFNSKDKLYVYSVWYMGKNLAVEFYLESRDQDIDCCVSRLIDGKIPEDWAINERGERVRMRLSEWIHSNGIQAPLFTKVTGLSFEKELPVAVSDYARMLQNYGQAILEDRSEIFS